MSWVEIDTGVWAKEVDSPIDVVVLADLEAQIAALIALRDSIDVEFIHEDKDYEAWKRDEIRFHLEVLTDRIRKKQEIVDDING